MTDRILLLSAVADKTGKSVDTLRWYRHRQLAGYDEGPRMFKLGRTVVAKESDVDAWIEAQYAAAREEARA